MPHIPSRRWTLAAALALTLLTATPAQASRRVTTWSPFAPDGSIRSGLHIAVRSGGDCWITAQAPVASPAQRCAAANLIRDPCFEPPDGVDPDDPTVVCAGSPWDRTVVRLHLDTV